MIGVIISFIISLTVAKVIIYTGEVHSQLTLDHDLSGIQKMHETPVPRVGGVAIFVSLVFTALYSANTGAVWSGFYAGLITALLFVSLSLVAAILGFLVFNYPKGKIFLGDGGSYSLGFMVSLISLNLTETYHHQISPYAILLLAVYPFTETVFSIVRRKFVHKTRAMAPDNLHLHQLIFDRCLPRSLPLIRRNSGVMPIMLLFIMPQLFMVMLYYYSNTIMLLGLLSYVVLYVYIYMRLIRFKVPRWLVVKKS